MPKFGTGDAWFGDFWAWIWKQHCHIWNQHPRICSIAKYHGKTTVSKFGTKHAWFLYFGQEFENNIPIFEINTLGFT